MKGALLVREGAKCDLDEHARHIAKDNIDSALRFLDAAERAFSLLAANPRAGSPREFRHPLLKQVRSWPIKGFPNHIIFYRAAPGGIEVIRVLHGARDIPSAILG